MQLFRLRCETCGEIHILFDDEFELSDDNHYGLRGSSCACGDNSFVKEPDIYTTNVTSSYMSGHMRFDSRHTMRSETDRVRKNRIKRNDDKEKYLNRKHNNPKFN